MPTPVGHAIGGLAVAWFSRSKGRLVFVCAIVAALPDLDIIFDSHRTYAHSVGAAVLAGVTAWISLRRNSSLAFRAAVVITAAYGSHVLLDWLGKDSSIPPGLMALWPFSPHFYISRLDFFGEVSRRYWKPDEFVTENLRTLGWELFVLGPIAAVAWLLQRLHR